MTLLIAVLFVGWLVGWLVLSIGLYCPFVILLIHVIHVVRSSSMSFVRHPCRLFVRSSSLSFVRSFVRLFVCLFVCHPELDSGSPLTRGANSDGCSAGLSEIAGQARNDNGYDDDRNAYNDDRIAYDNDNNNRGEC